MSTRVGYVSDDYRHIVDAQRRPLMLITDYSAEGQSAILRAVDGQGQRWEGVATVRPNARVVMHKSRD